MTGAGIRRGIEPGWPEAAHLQFWGSTVASLPTQRKNAHAHQTDVLTILDSAPSRWPSDPLLHRCTPSTTHSPCTPFLQGKGDGHRHNGDGRHGFKKDAPADGWPANANHANHHGGSDAPPAHGFRGGEHAQQPNHRQQHPHAKQGRHQGQVLTIPNSMIPFG